MKLSIDVTCEPLESIAAELTKLRKIAAHQAGWPTPPNPTQIPSILSGAESPMGIEIILTPTDINLEPFSDDDKAEISQWQFIPVFDGVDQPAIRGDKGSLDPVKTVAPEGVSVFSKYGWVDNAGNVSTGPVNTDTVLASDLTPPLNPVQVPGIAVGDEVPE